MAVAAEDPLTRMRQFVTEKPEQFKQAVDAWTAKQPLWVEGVVAGVTGSFQVRWRGCDGSLGHAPGGCTRRQALGWGGAQPQHADTLAPALCPRRAPSLAW